MKNWIKYGAVTLLIILLVTPQGLFAAEECEEKGGLFFRHPTLQVGLIAGFASALCICGGGMMAGLTIGFFSVDLMTLEIMAEAGTKKEKKQAKRLLPLIKRHHHLLITLLLMNALFLEMLPLFLDKLVHEVLAIIISVTFILFFGEVIPQAVCSRFALQIGSNFFINYSVRLLMIVTAPISWPIAKLLDCLLGTAHKNLFPRSQLKQLVTIHGDTTGPLNQEELNVIRGALEVSDKHIGDIMTPWEHVFKLSVDDKLDRKTLQKIVKNGHTRIPIYEGEEKNIVGLLLTKSLILLDPDDAIPVGQMELREVIKCPVDTNIWDQLNIFQEKRSHLAFVLKQKIEEIGHRPSITLSPDSPIPKPQTEKTQLLNHKDEEKDDEAEPNDLSTHEIVGIVTLEDIFEEVIAEEIVDETDQFVTPGVKVSDMYRRMSLARLRERKSMDLYRRNSGLNQGTTGNSGLTMVTNV